jgi:D-aspartate ligase
LKKTNNKYGAIVIGGHIQGLGLIRNLGMFGIQTILIDKNEFNIARFSKYCAKYIKAPTNLYNENIFLNYLITINLKLKLGKWVIYPTDDRTVYLLSKYKEKLSEYYTIWTPEWNIVKYFYDKKMTYLLADKLKIPYPISIYPQNTEEIDKIEDKIKFPIIIKPAIMQQFYEITKQKVYVANNYFELHKYYKKACDIIGSQNVIIQEIIPGRPEHLYSYGSFYKKNKTMGYIIGRRKRQIPMDFGKGSTFVELCNIPEIKEYSEKILSSIGYYGLSEVEFKYDTRDNSYKLLEVNPRTWRWHTLASHAGINLPLLLYNDIYQLPQEQTIQKISTQLKWRDIYSDLLISTTEIINKKMTIQEYINSTKYNTVDGVLDKNDIYPFIAETFLLPILVKER